MKRKINLEDVARIAGVSTATVSRVLNDYPFVKDETKKRVIKVIEETNYRVNAIARNLRRKKTHSIGVIVSNVLSPFYSIIAKSVEDIAIRNDYSTVLCNGGDNPEKELKYLRVLHENRVDGIIISPTGKNIEYINFLISSGIPVVFIDRVINDVECDTVLVNNREATYRLINIAINKGYRRIGCISGPENRYTGKERLEGYRNAIIDNSIEFDPGLIRFGDFTLESGRALANDLFESNDIDLLFVANSDMATGAFQVVKERKLQIPDDVGFSMFDDPIWTTLVTPNITAISQPIYTLGSTAADLLFKRILEGTKYIDQSPVKIILEAQLRERDSM